MLTSQSRIQKIINKKLQLINNSSEFLKQLRVLFGNKKGMALLVYYESNYTES